MGIRDTLIKMLQGSTETKQSNVMVYSNVGVSSYRRDKYENYAEEGYRQNAIVYRCVNEIAQGSASVDFKVFDKDIELEEHPLKALLQKPNPVMAGVEFFQCMYSYLMISGNSYVLKISAGNQPPTELYLLRPDRIRITGKENALPDAYEYIVSGVVKERYAVDMESGLSDIKHLKIFNPLDDYYGLSPLYSASLDVDQHNLSAKHNVNLLQNGARPSGAVVFKPRDESGMNVQLSESQRQQVINDLDMRFSGSQNAGRAMLLEGDFDWKEMGLSPKDMDFLQLKNMSTRDIALCFGVPSQLVGIPDANTYSNMAEARLALYEETIIPLLKRTESDLNEWLAPMFGERLRIQYDIDGIPAMAERRKRIYENVIRAVDSGVISRNEARERLDLEPIEGGDDVYINASLFPLGSAKDSPLDEEPQDDKSIQKGIDAYEIKEEVRRDVYTTEEEAERRASAIGCVGTHFHDTDNGRIYMPCASHADYERLTGSELKLQEYPDGEEVDPNLPDSYRMGTGDNRCGNCANYDYDEKYCDLHDAKVRIQYVCAKWEEAVDEKALADLDLTPTDGMKAEAQRGLDWRKEFNRGGTMVGVARANQLVKKERLSPSTVMRMYSFFSRHEVDKQGQGFERGTEGYPSAGRIAWALWGGDAGFSWSKVKSEQIKRERDKQEILDCEQKATVSGKIRKALEGKVKDHNEKHGDKKGKRVTLRMLSAVFNRGVGAYRTNPASVRPTVTGPDQWGLGRVNAFLFAVRSGRFRSGQFDRDLLPSGHPLKTDKRDPKKSEDIS